MKTRRLLLVSSSRVHGTGLLEHCREAIVSHFSQSDSVLFVPFALADHEQYESTIRSAFESFGVKLRSIHHESDPSSAIARSNGIFIGGGNSFRLLKTLYDRQLMEPIREAVARGVPYMGSSAGTNMACPTIRTTNDMPIVEPPSFEALGLVPFQINPHFIDADPKSTHKGETRAQRLGEFHEENQIPVVALREGSWLEIDGDQCQLMGKTGMKLFQPGQEPQELGTPTDLGLLMNND